MLLGFAVSVAYWPGMLSGVFVPRWAVIAVGVPLVSSLDLRNVYRPALAVMAIFMALAAISILSAPQWLTAVSQMIFLLILSGAFIAGAGMEDTNGVMTGLALGLVVSSVVCVMQFYGWNGVPQSAPPAGLFYNREVLAEFAAVIFVWALVSQRWALAAFAIVPLVFCTSRVALLAVALGLFYAYMPKSRLARLAALALIVGAAVASIIILGLGKIGSADHRVVLWGATIITIFMQPWGSGIGWTASAHPGEQFAHSDVLQVLVEVGLGAVILILIPIFALRRGNGNNAERAAFVSVCVECAISFPLHIPATGFVAAVLAGHLVGIRPLVRMGRSVGRVDDGEGLQRARNAGRGIALAS